MDVWRGQCAGLDPRRPSAGADVTRFRPGDEVLGISRGSFAEYAAAREDKLVRKPAGLRFEQAAVVAVSGLAALQGLRAGRIAARQKVLIIGASGGVGTYAVQLAKASGAKVTAVCSTRKVDLVRSIGADQVIDYTREDFADGRQHYDLILDIGGNSRLSRLQRALTPEGTLVIAGGEGARWTGVGRQIRALMLSPLVRQRLTMYISAHRQADLEALRQQIEAGHLSPIVGKTYTLPDVPEAAIHTATALTRPDEVFGKDIPRQPGLSCMVGRLMLTSVSFAPVPAGRI